MSEADTSDKEFWGRVTGVRIHRVATTLTEFDAVTVSFGAISFRRDISDSEDGDMSIRFAKRLADSHECELIVHPHLAARVAAAADVTK